MRLLLVACVGAWLMVAPVPGWPQAIPVWRDFDARTPAMLRAAKAGRPFVLALWSAHCEPCRGEMPLWREMRAKHPGVDIVLVSTDPPHERELLARFLERHPPGPVERWSYADEFEERTRYAIDPRWRGELPRTYYFDADHRMEAITGKPDPERVRAWFGKVDGSLARPGR